MNYLDWNQHELARQIKALGFGQYAHEFIKNEICGVHLPLITEEHLVEMGVTRIGHRVLLIRRFADIVNNRIPTQTTTNRYSSSSNMKSVSSSINSSPAIDPKYIDSLSEDTGPSIISKRTEIPKSPNKKVEEKKYNRIQKNIPTDDDDASSHSSTSYRSSRSNRSQSTKAKSNNNQFGQTEVPSRGGRQTSAQQQQQNDQDIKGIAQQKDNRITCQYCGRKFQPDAANRHIRVCGKINGKNPKK